MELAWSGSSWSAGNAPRFEGSVVAVASDEASGVVDVVGATETGAVVDASVVVANPESKEPSSPAGATGAEASVLAEDNAGVSLPPRAVEGAPPSLEGDASKLAWDDGGAAEAVAEEALAGSVGESA